MYHFNENNIVAGYIKELLHNFNLPTCEVFVPNITVVYPNTNYIYNNSLIKTESDITIGTYNDLTLDEYDFVCSYVYGQKIINITKSLKLNSILYDTYTHEYLGNFLRFIRDERGIDLMMLYNCFSNRLVDNLIYTNKFNAEDDQYKIYAVPIKLDKNYLIGIDCDSKVELVCGLFDDNLQVTKVETGDSETANSLYQLSYREFNCTQFNNPFEYFVDSTNIINNTLIKQYESCLKLFIKIPAQNTSSISVVEVSGSTAQFKQKIDGSVSDMVLIDRSSIMEYPTKLSLFKMNDNVSYPFAIRLLEYLFGQAITCNEQIPENIEKVQRQLFSSEQVVKNHVRLQKLGTYGVWNNAIRDTIYDAVTQDGRAREIKYIIDNEEVVGKSKFINNCYDLTCYVDKDVESLITVISD